MTLYNIYIDHIAKIIITFNFSNTDFSTLIKYPIPFYKTGVIKAIRQEIR